MTKVDGKHGMKSYRGALLGLPLALAFLALAPAARADLQAGVLKYQAGDYKGAIDEWKPLAEKGDPNALFNMGQAYRLGRGLTADPKTALDYYTRAANLGHVAAQGNAGTILYFAEAPLRDRKQAVDWWQKASANGDPRAQYMLGVLYFNGRESNGDGVDKDYPKAYALTSAAKSAGLSEAASALEKMDRFLSDEDKAAAQAILPTLKTGSTPAPIATTTQIASGESRRVAPPPAAPKPMPVAVEAPMPAPVSAPAPADASGWRVQLGAFGNENAARKAWGDIQNAHGSLTGVDAFYETLPNGTVRLQVGGYANRGGADALCGKLKSEQMSCFVVKPSGK